MSSQPLKSIAHERLKDGLRDQAYKIQWQAVFYYHESLQLGFFSPLKNGRESILFEDEAGLSWNAK